MKKIASLIPSAGMFLAALTFNLPVSAAEPGAKDSVQAGKTAAKAAAKDDHGHGHEGHDHGKHEGKEKDHKGHDHSKPEAKAHDHAGHDHGAEGQPHKAVGLGKTDIRDISTALRTNLACMEKEMASANHDVFHGCLEAIGALGVDLIALKVPVDPAKKKRVNGYAKNLARMTHKVDGYRDAGHADKARDHLKKLKAQVEMIEGQFPELAKK